jgi:hypothetical protein
MRTNNRFKKGLTWIEMRWPERLVIVLIWYAFLMVLLGLLTGCTTEPRREFGRVSEQDRACLNRFGGAYGYCDSN